MATDMETDDLFAEAIEEPAGARARAPSVPMSDRHADEARALAAELGRARAALRSATLGRNALERRLEALESRYVETHATLEQLRARLA